MIVFIEGEIARKTPANVWMQVGGIGYDVNISLNTYEQIQDWKKGKLYIYHHITEQTQSLYGFFDEGERELFLHLISVSGIGTSTARVALSGMKPSEIRNAIINGNEGVIKSIKGIGPKTAQRLILELKDKLLKSSENLPLQATEGNNLSQDALTALVSLGIARNVAYKAVQKVLSSGEYQQVEEVIKLALKQI
jgi:Holliday junction DNA helicase RuvA